VGVKRNAPIDGAFTLCPSIYLGGFYIKGFMPFMLLRPSWRKKR
jgi:hypothetical protein